MAPNQDYINKLIEEMYTERYNIEMQNIRAAMNRIVEEEDIMKEIRDFNEYVYDYLLRKYKGATKKTDEVLYIALFRPLSIYSIRFRLRKVKASIFNYLMTFFRRKCIQRTSVVSC